MPSYLVCRNWRSSITVSSMRVFDNLNDALDYYLEIRANRFYEIHSDIEPYLISNKKVKKMIENRMV